MVVKYDCTLFIKYTVSSRIFLRGGTWWYEKRQEVWSVLFGLSVDYLYKYICIVGAFEGGGGFPCLALCRKTSCTIWLTSCVFLALQCCKTEKRIRWKDRGVWGQGYSITCDVWVLNSVDYVLLTQQTDLCQGWSCGYNLHHFFYTMIYWLA